MKKMCKFVGVFLVLTLLTACAQSASEFSSNISFSASADSVPVASFPASGDLSSVTSENTPAVITDSEQVTSSGANSNGIESIISTDPSFSETDTLFWQKQAEILTTRLVKYCFPTNALGGMQAKDVDGEMALRFIASFVFFDDDSEDIYFQEISSVKTEDGDYYSIPIESAQKVLYQCFGINDWTVPADDGYFDSVTRTLRIPRDIGFGNTFCAKNMTVSFLNHNTIQVYFDLEGSDLWPDAESYGAYIVTLSFVQNDTTFLRFCNLQPLS